MQIKVSVLVYVRNDKQHIRECMKSVMGQTLREIEILAIDGGSTDGTLEILEEMAEQDSRIRIFQAIPSVGAQFNLGVQEARGEYIGICESDDYILPDMYETQYKIAKENQLDILKADFNRFCGDGEDRIVLPFHVLDGDTLYGKILRPRDGEYMVKMGIISYWSGLYRRDFLVKGKILMNETAGAAYQDAGFAFQSLYKAERVMFSREAFYCYRWDNPNSSVNAPKKIEALIEEYTLLRESLLKDDLFETSKEFYFAWKVDGLKWYYSILPESQKKLYAQRLFLELSRDLESGVFQGNRLGTAGPEILQKVRQSEESLEEYLRKEEEKTLGTRQRLEQLGEDRVVIFGNGNMGKLVRNYLQYKGIQAAAYMDNNKDLWGQSDAGVSVLAPEEGVRQFMDAIYIIANVNHYEEIEQQLLQLGIQKENMIVCRDYESLLF